MDFLDKRINVICNELDKLRKKNIIDFKEIYYRDGKIDKSKILDLKEKKTFKEIDANNFYFTGKDKYYWIKADIKLSKEYVGKKISFHIHTQIEEWDDAKNPQFLVFVNGKVKQGLDMNHRDIIINNYNGDLLKLDLETYSGTLHEDFKVILKIFEIDEKVEKLYYDILVPLQAFDRLDKQSSARYQIEEVLNNCINLIDLRDPYSKEFYDSISKAQKYIDKALYKDLSNQSEVIASVIGHTHIDVAWWWTVAQTRDKVCRSFATVLDLMDQYPDYKFMSSQPVLYEFVKQEYPELYKRIQERVKEGRWEVEGSMYVESDCNLTSGESLVRQIMYGKAFFKKEFNKDNKILWLPDVFGYSAALPQILKKSGVDYFMTTKLNWNQFNRMPHDTFLWKGIDGSSVLTHLITTVGVHQSIKDFFTTYNGLLHPDSIIGAWDRYQDKDINNDILISYGYGDGGGGPTIGMLETSLRMNKGIKGIPKSEQKFAYQYFKELDERVSDNKRLSTWNGELYFEYHRGTLTSMAKNKLNNRTLEISLMNLEFISVLADKVKSYPYDFLEKTWKMGLLNQFHDILPGTSIKEVYEVTDREYEKALSEIDKELKDGLLSMHDEKMDENYLTFYNPTSFNLNTYVNFEVKDAKGDLIEEGKAALIDDQGNQSPILGNYVYLRNLPSKGYKSFKVVELEGYEGSDDIKLVNDHNLQTPFYNVIFDDNYNIKSLYDKKEEREVLKSEGNLFRLFEDKPIYYDNWDIDIYYTEKYWDLLSYDKASWVYIGSERAVLRISRSFSKSTLIQEITFYAKSGRIDFETNVNYNETQHLLKVFFPIDINTDEATFDTQFGNIKRKTHTNTSWDKARFEVGAHKWADVSEGNYGVALINNCKYGYSVHESTMALTLIKTGIEPNPVADKGLHVFKYALYPHKGDYREAEVIKESYDFNFNLLYSPGYRKEGSFASTNKRNVIIDTIKKAEDKDGYILRLYEGENSRTNFTLTFDNSFKKAFICNLLEENEGDAIKIKNNELSLSIKPFEILSIRVK